MRVGLYTNKTKEYCLLREKALHDRLSGAGVNVKAVEDISDISEIDFLVVLGGDGTILKVCGECARKNIPILGVNLGNLGFLTEFEKDEEDAAVDLLLSADFVLDTRSLIDVTCADIKALALNDVVVQRVFTQSCDSQVARLTAKIDGEFVDTYTCDGLIVCTPTGSTAYSLSGGGSILTPTLSAFCLTPVCAHSLRSRPIVFSDQSSALIIPENSKAPTMLVCDGKTVCEVTNKSPVQIKKSVHKISFIRRKDSSFFKRLSGKLSQWSVE